MGSEEFEFLLERHGKFRLHNFFDLYKKKSTDNCSLVTKAKRKTFFECVQETNVFHSFKKIRSNF